MGDTNGPTSTRRPSSTLWTDTTWSTSSSAVSPPTSMGPRARPTTSTSCSDGSTTTSTGPGEPSMTWTPDCGSREANIMPRGRPIGWSPSWRYGRLHDVRIRYICTFGLFCTSHFAHQLPKLRPMRRLLAGGLAVGIVRFGVSCSDSGGDGTHGLAGFAKSYVLQRRLRAREAVLNRRSVSPMVKRPLRALKPEKAAKEAQAL